MNYFIKNKMLIRYSINKYERTIRIFGDTFVKNNKKNCKIIYNGKEKELNSFITIEENNVKDIIEINLILYKKMANMSYMFYDCSSLSSLSDIDNLNTNNVTDMSYMFYFCTSLSSLPDISKWNTNNVTNFSYMFYFCSSLSSLPDISK